MKIIFDLTNKTVTIDGSQDEAASLLRLVKEVSPSLEEVRVVMESKPESTGKGRGEDSGGGGSQYRTLRDFGKALSPAIQTERIAVIAYYVAKIQKQAAFSPKQMSDWLALCGWPKPSIPARAMFDTKKQRGYVESKGHGAWSISNEGENFVLGLLESKGLNSGGMA